MEITFRLTREDHRRFWRLVGARVTERACGWCTSPPVIFAASFATLVVLGIVHRFFGIGVAGPAYLSGVVSALFLVWVLQRRYLRCYFDDDSPQLAEGRLMLTSDGIEAARAAAATKYAWHGIKGLTETADLVVIWVDRALGIVVPARAFASDEARRTFVDTVRAHLRQGDRDPG
jgi:hypothetical protein